MKCKNSHVAYINPSISQRFIRPAHVLPERIIPSDGHRRRSGAGGGRRAFMKMYFKFAPPWIAPPPLSTPFVHRGLTWPAVLITSPPRVRSFIGRDDERGAHAHIRLVISDVDRPRSPDEGFFSSTIRYPLPRGLHARASAPARVRAWARVSPRFCDHDRLPGWPPRRARTPHTPVTVSAAMTNVIALSDDVTRRVLMISRASFRRLIIAIYR